MANLLYKYYDIWRNILIFLPHIDFPAIFRGIWHTLACLFGLCALRRGKKTPLTAKSRIILLISLA